MAQSSETNERVARRNCTLSLEFSGVALRMQLNLIQDATANLTIGNL